MPGLFTPIVNRYIIKAHAKTTGEYVNAFITRAIDEAMEREAEK